MGRRGRRDGSAPGQERARAHLEESILRTAAAGQTRLAPIAVLARQSGVAYATMHKAVRSLVREGRLSARPSAGLHVIDAAPEAAGVPSAATATRVGRTHGDRVCAALERDLTLGVYRAGERLPSLKELVVRYGASTSVLRRALARAYDLGWLTSPSRPLVAHARGVADSSATVVILGGENAGHPLFGLAAMRLADYECRSAGLRLVHYPFHTDQHIRPRPSGLVAAMKSPGFVDSVAGFVVCTSGLTQRAFDEALSYVARCGAPIAVVDDMGVARSRLPSASGADLLVLSAGTGPGAGRAVAAHLARAGHLHVAYLSPSHNHPSSQARLAGLREGLTSVGGTVLACTSREDPGVTRVTRAWRKAWPTVRGFASSEELRQVLSRHARSLAERALNGALLDLLTTQVVYDAVEPLARQAMRSSDVTAWVGFSDAVAFACRDVSDWVSQGVLLVGMDNTVRAQQEGLTSYDFNGPAIMRGAVSHIVHSRRSTRRSTTPRVIEVEGFVVDRGP